MFPLDTFSCIKKQDINFVASTSFLQVFDFIRWRRKPWRVVLARVSRGQREATKAATENTGGGKSDVRLP